MVAEIGSREWMDNWIGPVTGDLLTTALFPLLFTVLSEHFDMFHVL